MNVLVGFLKGVLKPCQENIRVCNPGSNNGFLVWLTYNCLSSLTKNIDRRKNQVI